MPAGPPQKTNRGTRMDEIDPWTSPETWAAFLAGIEAGVRSAHETGRLEGRREIVAAILPAATALAQTGRGSGSTTHADLVRRRTTYTRPPRSAHEIRVQARQSWSLTEGQPFVSPTSEIPTQALTCAARSLAAVAGRNDPAATLAAVSEAIAALQAITHTVATSLDDVAVLPRSTAGAHLHQARSLVREVVDRLGEARARCLQASTAAEVVLPH